MDTRGLDLNSIPPLFIPLRFFLSAPVFGILAALLIIFVGENLWQSRWSPSSLSLTHLFTVGFMLMIMLGALFQFVPVISGQLIPGTLAIVPVIHPLMVVGGFSLSGAFLLHSRLMYFIGFMSLGITALLFMLALARLLFATSVHSTPFYLLRIVLLALVFTLALGLYMLLAYSFPELGIGYRMYTNVHAGWGLIGWVVLLIMTISYQVIPMFHVTPAFSESYLKGLSIAIFVNLILLSSVSIPVLKWLLELLLSLELVFFSLYTLWLILKRKRKVADVTINFWYLSLLSLLLCLLFYWLMPLMPWGHNEQYQMVLAVFLIYGLAIGSMMGMLQKIIPFLVYLHLQRMAMKHPTALSGLPTMKDIIKVRHSQWQYFLHLGSLMTLVLSVYIRDLTVLAGVLVMVDFLFLEYCLIHAVYTYKQCRKRIIAEPEMDYGF